MKDEKIILLCKRGKPEGFEMLVHQYSNELMAICVRYLKDRNLAKDALQNCFISIFKSIGNYKHSGNFGAWLRKIAVNSSLKELRKRKWEVTSLNLMEENSFLDMSVDPIAYQHLNEESIVQLLEKLPEDYRIVFNLYIIEEYPYKEIAELLSISQTNCRMKVSRARKMLQKIILQQKENYGLSRSRKVD